MIINTQVLGELLLAAGYGTPTNVEFKDQVNDFEIRVELDPMTPKQAPESFAPAEVLEALHEKFDVASNILTIDMRQPNTHRGVTLETISYTPPTKEPTKKPTKKPRQLKRLGHLRGLTIESVKIVKQGTKVYIRTTDGAGICLEHAVVAQTLHPDENIALGLLTKEDLASIAKAKKMGLLG